MSKHVHGPGGGAVPSARRPGSMASERARVVVLWGWEKRDVATPAWHRMIKKSTRKKNRQQARDDISERLSDE